MAREFPEWVYARQQELGDLEKLGARIINPWAWRQFDAAVRPFDENRGAQDPEGLEQFWYALTWGNRGYRKSHEVRRWFLEEELLGAEPLAIFAVRESLEKSRTYLAAILPRVEELVVKHA